MRSQKLEMQLDLQKRDQLLAKAKASIMALSHENEQLYRLLAARNTEIERMKSSTRQEARETMNLSANTTGEFFKVNAQPYMSNYSTPSLITTDYFNTSLNNIEARRFDELQSYKQQLQAQIYSQEELLTGKIEILQIENAGLKQTEEYLRDSLAYLERQVSEYRQKFATLSAENQNLTSVYQYLAEITLKCQYETETKESLQNLVQLMEKQTSATEQTSKATASDLERIKGEYQALLSKYSAAAAELPELKQEKAKTDIYLGAFYEEMQALRLENKYLKATTVDRDVYNQTQQGKIEQQAQELTKYKCKIDSLQARNDDLDAYLREYTEELTDLRVLTQNAIQLQDKFTQQQVLLYQVSNDKALLEKQCGDLRVQLAGMSYMSEKTGTETMSMRFELHQSKEQADQLAQQVTYKQQLVDSLIEKISALENMNGMLNGELDALRKKDEKLSKSSEESKNSMQAELKALQAKLYQLESQTLEKNELLVKLTNEKTEAQAQQNLLYRLLDEISRDLTLYVNPERQRQDVQVYFYEIADRLKENAQEYQEAQQLVQEFQLSLEKLNEKQLKQEQLLKIAKDELLRKQENEGNLTYTVGELQKQVALYSEQVQSLQSRLLEEEYHRQRLKRYVYECKEKIGMYELKNQEYHAQLEEKEANVEGQVERLHQHVAYSIQEFSYNVLQQLRSENKEQAINEILKLSKTFLV